LKNTDNTSDNPTCTENELAEIAARKAATAHMNTYISARDKYAERSSSAWTFLLVGFVGLLLVALHFFGIINLPFGTFTLLILTILFSLFLLISILSFVNAVKLSDQVSREEELESRIQEWTKENLKKEELISGLEPDLGEELQYFEISAIIRDRLMHAFPEIDDAYAEALSEDIYNKLFL